MTIETSLQSIENKLDALILTIQSRPANDIELDNRLGDADSRFNSALAMLSTLQGCFTGTGDAPNDSIVYFSIEGARNEIKAAYNILAAGTIYEGGCWEV